MNNSLKRRIERLSARSEEWGDVLDLIRAKKRYRELTDDQKRRYCLYYYGMDYEVIEAVEQTVEDKPLDFVLKKRPARLTAEEEQERISKAAREIEERILMETQ